MGAKLGWKGKLHPSIVKNDGSNKLLSQNRWVQMSIFQNRWVRLHPLTHPKHSELFCLFSFGNWKFENLPISIPLCIKMFFRPYIFVIQSKKVYRLSRTLIKIAFNSGGNCFFAYFSIFSLVSQGRYLVKSHICGILWRK